jgi:hypothetical protein
MPEFWSSLADGGLPQQHRQLGDVGCNPLHLVAGEQLGCGLPARLILEIDVGERLPVGVADDEAGVCFLTGKRCIRTDARRRYLNATARGTHHDHTIMLRV